MTPPLRGVRLPGARDGARLRASSSSHFRAAAVAARAHTALAAQRAHRRRRCDRAAAVELAQWRRHPVCAPQSFASRALSEETRAEGTPVARRVMARLRAVEGKNPMRMLQAFYTQWRWVTRDEVGTLGGVRALVATGAEDRLTPPAWAEAVRQAIPSAAGDDETAHVVQGAGHQVMQEQPQHTIQLIESFLRRVLQ